MDGINLGTVLKLLKYALKGRQHCTFAHLLYFLEHQVTLFLLSFQALQDDQDLQSCQVLLSVHKVRFLPVVIRTYACTCVLKEDAS
jgi:hypothetical protein